MEELKQSSAKTLFSKRPRAVKMTLDNIRISSRRSRARVLRITKLTCFHLLAATVRSLGRIR